MAMSQSESPLHPDSLTICSYFWQGSWDLQRNKGNSGLSTEKHLCTQHSLYKFKEYTDPLNRWAMYQGSYDPGYNLSLKIIKTNYLTFSRKSLAYMKISHFFPVNNEWTKDLQNALALKKLNYHLIFSWTMLIHIIVKILTPSLTLQNYK